MIASVPLTTSEARRDIAWQYRYRRLTSPVALRFSRPTLADHVIFVCGVPVAPWVQPRPACEVWAIWLQRLREVLAEQTDEHEGDTRQPPDDEWRRWLEAHVHFFHVRRVREGVARLAALLGAHADEPGEAHVIGHSAGGATVLGYLAGLRNGALALPGMPIRSAITLDASVSGLAARWSDVRSYLRDVAGSGWQELSAWSQERGISVLTASNELDIWSHRALADLPYLGVRIGPTLTFRRQLNGVMHDVLRRTPQVVHAVWGQPPSGTHHELM